MIHKNGNVWEACSQVSDTKAIQDMLFKLKHMTSKEKQIAEEVLQESKSSSLSESIISPERLLLDCEKKFWGNKIRDKKIIL